MSAPDAPGVDLDGLHAALTAAAPTLDPTGSRVAREIHRSLARGEAPTSAQIAAAAGAPAPTVERAVGAWPALFRDDAGRIIAFWGLGLVETSHRIRSGGTESFAWCAWDPLFLAHVIGPLSVRSTDPETGDTITYRLDGRGTVHDLSHPKPVLSFLLPDRWDVDVMTNFCHHVHLFANADAGRRWTARQPRTFTLDLDQAVELAAGFAENTLLGGNR